MRKIIFTFLLLFAAVFTVYSQTDQGDWLVGGSININTAEGSSTIGFSPSAGVFVIGNFAVGANLVFVTSKTGNTRQTDFGIGPFTRFYFTKADVRPFLHGDLNFLSSKTKLTNISNTNSGFNYSLGVGLAFFINENIAVEGVAGYDHTKYKGFEGAGGFAFNLGFQVYLRQTQVDKLRGR